MQLSIIAGFVISFGALCLSVMIESEWNIHALGAFFNQSAMITIFGGISGVIVVAFPVDELKEIPGALKKAFMNVEGVNMVVMANKLLALAQKSRQEGILALEGELPNLEDDWMRKGLQMVVDGIDRAVIRDVMEQELDEFSRKIGIGPEIFQQLGGFAPTLGIIGTVMGLVNMLAHMEDASKLGGAISVAFLATFWGILSANLIFLPIAARIKVKNTELSLTRQAMIEGILSIHAGESVRILEEKLKVFMNHEQREKFDTERATPA
ncbi:MAG: MotA/TolQ/ExbB proton channel family protein [Candidatus Riflebacteria bacterium]|nr:MotA/TolQ/ExbB proton channel family protein [Candidatus Riflebacteria bacterium]